MKQLDAKQKARVKLIIADKLGFDNSEIESDMNLRDVLGMDSLDAIEIIMEFENEFNIFIEDQKAERILTVQDAFNLIGEHL